MGKIDALKVFWVLVPVWTISIAISGGFSYLLFISGNAIEGNPFYFMVFNAIGIIPGMVVRAIISAAIIIALFFLVRGARPDNDRKENIYFIIILVAFTAFILFDAIHDMFLWVMLNG